MQHLITAPKRNEASPLVVGIRQSVKLRQAAIGFRSRFLEATALRQRHGQVNARAHGLLIVLVVQSEGKAFPVRANRLFGLLLREENIPEVVFNDGTKRNVLRRGRNL